MAVARIDDLDVDFEADGAQQEAGHSRGFVPFEVRTRCQLKALPATGMIERGRRDVDRFIAVGIVVGDDSDISRDTDAGIDRAPS